jgi:hypothetical protein
MSDAELAALEARMIATAPISTVIEATAVSEEAGEPPVGDAGGSSSSEDI